MTSELLQKEFRNERLSVSRLKLYEQCPRAFYYKYVEKSGPETISAQAPLFGIVLHAALESVYGWILQDEYAGLFPVEMALQFYRQAWQESELVTVDLFQQGLNILRTYARSHETVDHFSILAVEQEFNIVVDGYPLNGFIDRVDKVSDEEVRIADYKSNWQLFTADELKNDLQMSVYGLAARTLYPWAKRVSFAFDMLRHDITQTTERTAQTIDDAREYVIALGKRTETDKEWRPKIDTNCKYCDHREKCEAYQTVLKGKHHIVPARDMGTMSEVLREREETRKVANLLYARQKELDKIVSDRLKKSGEFTEGNIHCRFIVPHSTTYDVKPLIRAFVEAGATEAEAREKVFSLDKDLVEEFRVELTAKLPRPRALMLKASIEACEKRTPLTPKIDIKEQKQAKTKESAERIHR